MFFLGVDWVTQQLAEFKCGGQILAPPPPPICLVSLSSFFFFFSFASSFFLSSTINTIHPHLHLAVSSSPHHFFSKKYFSKLLNVPSLIYLNIFLDPCVLDHFCYTPIFVKPIFKPIFSLHQNVIFFQWTLFSYFSWKEISSMIWME